MVDWSAARAFTESAVAETFDVTELTLQPRRRGATVNHADSNDSDREAFDFMGTIDLEPPADRITRHLPNDPGVRNGTVSFDAVLTANVSAWPYRPERSDAVIVKATGKRWKIAAMEEDGSSRPAYYLTKL